MRALRSAVLAFAVAGSGCAILNRAAAGDVGGAIGETARKAAVVEGKAKECDRLAQAEVGWAEESSIGSAVALGLAGKVPLFVDLGTFDPKTLTISDDGSKTSPKTLDVMEGARAELGRYLTKVGRHLATFSSRPTITWTFGVIDDAAINAFSAPGGYVFVTTGLLKSLKNEDQLAGVLGHEIAHITQRHALAFYKESKVSTCRWAIPLEMGKDEATAGANRASGGMVQKTLRFADLVSGGAFNPDQLTAEAVEKLTDTFVEAFRDKGLEPASEFESDAVATDLMVFAGYDGREYASLLTGLSDDSKAASKHPKSSERAQKITARLGSEELSMFVNPKSKPRPLASEVAKALK